MRVVMAGDIAGSARSAAGLGDSPLHGGEHVRMLTHAKVVIAAPHGDDSFRAVGPPPDRCGQRSDLPFEVDEGSVPAISLEIIQQGIEL
jgi:hypothetical protein